MKIWDRAACIGLAKVACHFCHGNGTLEIRYDRVRPCNCVMRAAFRACFNRFRECRLRGEAGCLRIDLERHTGGPSVSHRTAYAFKQIDYQIDFFLIAKRTLRQPLLYSIFQSHVLGGFDWKVCCARLGIDRGTFFHAVYALEERVGRAFVETEPYALYPLDEYFGGARKVCTSASIRPRPNIAPNEDPVHRL